ncbi:MAG: S41 family peptidase, partial [Defluviitaleaceae bacterium]|nr:S41 family peptidase [Defluviitaleaceae bacterium]
MKRPLIALIIIIIALTLVACDADDEVYETYEPEIEDEITERNVEPAPGLMTEYFLQDLDYMLHTLENNFALFDVAYWARGVDIPAIAKNIRAEILANPEMSVEEFYRALTRNFGPLTGIAHFMFINPPTIQYFIDNPWSPALTRVVSSEPLTLPHVLDFYESMASTPEQPYTRTLTERGIRHIVKRSILYGERELAEEMMESFRSGDYEGVMMLLDSFFEITSNIPNVRTEVIEENRIAYLSIDSFSSYLLATWPEEEAQILNFLGEIRDFDHLIIDLRRNQGGDPFYFIDAV